MLEFNQWNSKIDQTEFGVVLRSRGRKKSIQLFSSLWIFKELTWFELKPRLETQLIVFNNYKWSFTSSKMECSSTWKNSCRIQSIRFTHVSCHVNQCLGFILDIGSTHLVYLDLTNPSIHVITNYSSVSGYWSLNQNLLDSTSWICPAKYPDELVHLCWGEMRIGEGGSLGKAIFQRMVVVSHVNHTMGAHCHPSDREGCL